MSGPVPDIACGHFLGDSSCALPWKHDGDHQPAEVVVVDRHLQPLNRRRVRSNRRGGRVKFAHVTEYKGRTQVSLEEEHEDDPGIQILSVNRPAVRVGDRWIRRVPSLQVVA